MPDPFATARAVADAVLYEGYVLYPYRASSDKNRSRWQFGVLMPPDYVATDPSERSSCRTELVLEAKADAVLRVEVRFLHVQHRTGGGRPEWDETVERIVTVEVAVQALPEERLFRFDAASPDAAVPDADDAAHRDAAAVGGAVVITLAALPGPYGAFRLRVDVENRTVAEPADRHEALRHALVAAHTMLAVDRGRFLSMTDPPEWAVPDVAGCRNIGTWPVLVGSEHLVLSSPIILGDNPEIAAESPGDLYDATEIDEILTLRTMTLTDTEKAEARATDARAAAVIDQVDGLPPEHLDRLHGALRYLRTATGRDERGAAARTDTMTGPDTMTGLDTMMSPGTPWWDPGADSSVSPEHDAIVISGVRVVRGSRVRLNPGARRTDAQDLFLRGRTATVEAVLFDVDGQQHLGVTPDDDDELAEITRWHGRYLYFAPDEVEPL